MSQAVQLDMEVFKRIKFLMEYDVTKTSSENILVEQPRVKGASASTSQSPDSQGKLGNTFDPISGQAKVLASRDPAVLKANQQKYGTIDVARTDVSKMYSKTSQEVKDKTLEEVTVIVRSILSDWRVMTVETLATVLGIGIPIVVGVNSVWLSLEVIQALKGNPSYLDLLFAFIATATSGTQSALLKPLYSSAGRILKGKGKSLVETLNALFQSSKELGLWNKLKPILYGIKSMSKTILDLIKKSFKLFSESRIVTKIGSGIVKGSTWLGNVFSRSTTFVSNLFKQFDTWLANIAIKGGMNPKVAQKLGSAGRSAGLVGGIGYALSPSDKPLPELPGLKYSDCSFCTNN